MKTWYRDSSGNRWEVWPTIRATHDGNLDGEWDDDGFIKGDSGGPAYYSYNGGAAVVGIVTSFAIYGVAGEYYFTQLAGVREWNSGATIFP